MMLSARRVQARLWPITMLLAAVTILGAASAHAGDGVQFAGDCFSTYVNKKVGDTEQWAITWQIDGNATGNVFKLDGSAPSFIECDLVAEDFDKQTVTFDCFGSSACTGPPCGGQQWAPIATNLEIAFSFFLPPGVNPEDPITDCTDRFGD